MGEVFSELPVHARGSQAAITARRVLIALFAAAGLTGLLNLVGQRTTITTVDTPAATVRVEAPETVRGGLFFQTRIDIDVKRGFEAPRLIFDRGVFEGMQVSSIEPAAESESSRDGRVELSYPEVIAGERLTVWLQFQVDPTATGSHGYDIQLDEGTREVARVDRDLRVLP